MHTGVTNYFHWIQRNMRKWHWRRRLIPKINVSFRFPKEIVWRSNSEKSRPHISVPKLRGKERDPFKHKIFVSYSLPRSLSLSLSFFSFFLLLLLLFLLLPLCDGGRCSFMVVVCLTTRLQETLSPRILLRRLRKLKCKKRTNSLNQIEVLPLESETDTFLKKVDKIKFRKWLFYIELKRKKSKKRKEE